MERYQVTLGFAESTWESIATSTPRYHVSDLIREEPRNGISPSTNNTGVGLKTVSTSAVTGGRFEMDGNIKYAEIEAGRVRSYFVQQNDVFVVRGNGNRNLTGKSGIANQSYDDLFYPDLLIRLRFDEAKILPRFAVAQWNSPSVHRRLVARAKSTNGIWKVNGGDLREHLLAVPPISVQVRFLAELDQLESARNRLRRRLTLVRETKMQALQKGMFGAA
ncbi:MAG: hypothetical protein IT317_21655 [Anaerolineales bacterium]|nr:hypothetical protein [Anaerolineales bacterium]